MKIPGSRQIKVFISSTFRDMNDERDFLNNYIFPQIADYCSQRFIEFIPIDLRWGITEEDSRNGLIINACLEQIDEAMPFFIGILGSRYGWIPSERDLSEELIGISNNRWIYDKIKSSSSITEIEIDYALSQKDIQPNSCFLLRDDSVEIPEDFREKKGSIEYKKLMHLKQKIKQSGFPVYEYDSLETLGETIKKHLLNLIKSLYRDSGNYYHDYLKEKHEYALKLRTDSLYDLSLMQTPLVEWMNSSKKTFLITSESGGGSSYVLCSYVSHLRKNNSLKVIYYDFEQGYEFNAFMQMECNTIPSDKKTFVVLDNCSILNSDRVWEIREWIDNSPDNCHILCSANNSSFFYLALSYYYRAPGITLTGLTKVQRKEFTINYLKKYGKKLTEEQLEKITSLEFLKDPTILTSVLHTLSNYGSMEKLDEFIDNFFKPAVFTRTFDKQVKLLQQIGGTTDFVRSMTMIALIEEGVSEQEIISFLKIPYSRWSAVRPYIMQWCNGNVHNLKLLRNEWRYSVISSWDYTIVSFGKRLIYWLLEVKNIAVATPKIVSIFRQLPSLAVKREDYVEICNILHNIAKSPEVFLELEPSTGFVIWALLREKRMSEAPERTYGKDIDKVNDKIKINYYRRLVTIARGLNRGACESYCWSCISNIFHNTNENRSLIYSAKEKLAIGQGYAALSMVRHLVDDNSLLSIFKKKSEDHYPAEIRFESLILKASVYAAKGQWRKALSEIDKGYEILDNIDLDDNDDIDATIEDTIDILYNILFSCNPGIYRDIYEALIRWDKLEVVRKIDRVAGFRSLMAKAIIMKRVNDFKLADYYSFWALESARCLFNSTLCHSFGEAYILRNYCYYRNTGHYIKDSYQYNGYMFRPPKAYTKNLESELLKDIVWQNVDKDINEQIMKYNYFFESLVKEMQPIN